MSTIVALILIIASGATGTLFGAWLGLNARRFDVKEVSSDAKQEAVRRLSKIAGDWNRKAKKEGLQTQAGWAFSKIATELIGVADELSD